jgi:hypothetical protein
VIRPLSIMLILAGLFSSLMLTAPVLACGGGATDTVEALLERIEIAVKAVPVAVDELRQNGVLRVESYLYGSGPQYLLFSLNDPSIIPAMLEGTPKRGCNTLWEKLIPGETGYFFLIRGADGVYRANNYLNEPAYYRFDNPDSTVRLYTRDTNPYTQHIVDEGAFVDLITKVGGSVMTAPNAAPSYPRLAPLKLTTADGKYYLLPVDRNEPLEVTLDLLRQMTMLIRSVERPDWNEPYFPALICPGDRCDTSSPDGQNIASQRPFSGEVTWYSGIAPGRALLFSSTSDAIVVWNADQLTVYTLGYSRPDMEVNRSQAVQSVMLAGAPEQALGQAAWSPDGRLLAYSDGAGLWLLDVFTPDAEPRLLLAAEGEAVPLARAFSPLGRYLHLMQGDERLTLDTISGARWPDGIISPDDRLLLAFDTNVEVVSDMQLCPLLLLTPCAALRGTSVDDQQQNMTYYDQFTQAAWRDNSSFLVTVCREGDLTDCVIDRRYSEYGSIWRDSADYTPGLSFDYQPQHDALVVVQAGNHLLINGEAVDLSGTLAGTIVEAEWLPSLFYRR